MTFIKSGLKYSGKLVSIPLCARIYCFGAQTHRQSVSESRQQWQHPGLCIQLQKQLLHTVRPICSQSGQMWRCAANLYINTHLSGHGLITWPGEADNLRQVKHVNSFFLAPVCHAAAATSVSGKIIKKFTLTNGWSRNSSRTY